MSAALESGLFPEPERVDAPTMDGEWAITPAGWRWMLVGEDGQYLLIQGHVDDAAVAEVIRAADLDPDPDYCWDKTWARELAACPDHSVRDEECRWCQGIEPGNPWWEWSAPMDQLDAHRNERGYFQVTVIDVEV